MTTDTGRKFEIYPCGDPYSRAWDCSECAKWTDRVVTYQGNISGQFRKGALVTYLRRTYPGCRIRVRK